ncbi:MAG: abortive phage infection protein, partial [Candidatus Competibacteraceae bacterium]|nr:abortive phage infection protein [Candidatus Competibacteraceae bacterium]
MSIIHLRQINAYLQENYRGLIDLADVEEKSEEKEQAFRTRSLAAYALKTQAEIEFETSAQYVTDGFKDNGLDAVYYSRADRILYLVQSKWSQDGSGSVSVGDT